jgi:DNA recombination protein RmuC
MTGELGPSLVLLLGAAVGLGLGFVWGRRRAAGTHAAELGQLRLQLATQRQELEAQRGDERAGFASQQASLRALADEHYRQSERLRHELSEHKDQALDLTQRLHEVELELTELRVRAQEAQRAAAERMQLLREAREQLRTEFKQLSQQILEDKTEKLNLHSQRLVEGTIGPLREQLGDFKRRIEDVYDKEAKDRVSLAAQVQQLHSLNQTLSQQALHLTQALKGQSKVRGDWGEQTLTALLDASGLLKGIEYETQKSFKNAEGARRQPDVVVHLPDQREVVIDAKVSLTAYLEYCQSDDEETRQRAARAHVASLYGHISDLAAKDYASLLGSRAVDFVLLFVPIEPALLVALSHEPALFVDAYRRKIVIVGPSTLLATLRTIEGIWRFERQSKNAEEIARQAGELWDHLARTLDSLGAVGKHLDEARSSFDETLKRLATGRGNLRRRTEALQRLGVKGKRELPAAVMARLDAEADDAAEEGSEAEEVVVEHAPPLLPLAAGEGG